MSDDNTETIGNTGLSLEISGTMIALAASIFMIFLGVWIIGGLGSALLTAGLISGSIAIIMRIARFLSDD